MESPIVEQAQPPQWFRDIVWGTLLAGLCPPVPFPFLEDWGRNYLRRKMVRRVLIPAGLNPSTKQTKILAGEHDTGCFWQLLMLPFRWLRILRVLYWAFFANKMIRAVSDLFVEMYLLSFAVRTGYFQEQKTAGGDAPYIQLRATIEKVRNKADLHPFLSIFEKVFRDSAKLVLEFSRYIARWVWIRRKDKPASSDNISDADARQRFPRGDELIQMLWADRKSLKMLESTFQEGIQDV